MVLVAAGVVVVIVSVDGKCQIFTIKQISNSYKTNNSNIYV